MQPTNITSKQLEILILIYKYRFLNRNHIQQFLHHKEPRRIKSWLKNLTYKQILGRNYSQTLGENTKPAVYYLETKCRHILKDKPDIDNKLLTRVYRERIKSQRFIDHCLFLADVYFYLESQAQKNNNKLYFYTKTDLSSHHYLPYNRPDAYIALEEPSKTIKRYFLEIIDEGTPRFMIRKRVQQYLDYYESNKWQDKTNHPFPSILMVCPNETIKHFLQRHIAQVLEEEAEDEIAFFLAAKQSVSSSKMKTNIWQRVE